MSETTTKPVPLAPPPRRNPAIDGQTGLFTRSWLTWFDLMWKRQGEAHAPSNDELDDSLSATQADLTALQAELDGTQADLAQTQADLDTAEAALAQAQADLVALQTELDATQDDIDALLPDGPARTLTRYQADGSGIETTPGMATTADGKLGIGVPVPVEQLEVAGGLTVGAATPAAANGTLQWNGTDLQGRIAGAWVSLTVGASSVLPGTALSVARYAAGGTSVEEAPGVMVDATGRLGIGTTSPATAITMQGDTFAAGQLQQMSYNAAVGNPGVVMRRGRGTVAAPALVQAGDFSGVVSMQAWARNAANTADAWTQMGLLRAEVEQVDAQGRAGGRLTLWTAPPVSSAVVERLRLDASGNLATGAAVAGTGMTGGVVLKSGTAPSTSPADAVQLWSADTAGVAGQAGLHLRTEGGTVHVLGHLSGMGTHCVATLGSGASYRSLNVTNSQLFVRASSVQERPVALLDAPWVVSTDATRTGRLTLSVYDATAAREGLRLETSGTAAMLGVLGAAAVVRQTVPVAAVDPATTMALVNSLRTALVTFGFCV